MPGSPRPAKNDCETRTLQRAHVVAVHVLTQGDHFVVFDFEEESVAVVVVLAILEFSEPLRFDGGMGSLHNQMLDQDLRIAIHENAVSSADWVQEIVNDFLASVFVARALNSRYHVSPNGALVEKQAEFFEIARAQGVEEMPDDFFVFRLDFTHGFL